MQHGSCGDSRPRLSGRVKLGYANAPPTGPIWTRAPLTFWGPVSRGLVRPPSAHPRSGLLPAARVGVETETMLGVYANGEYVCHAPVEVGVGRGAN
jgi:hypothetical protein